MRFFSIALLPFSSCNLTIYCPHLFYKRDGVCMPPTSDHEQLFSRFDPTHSDDCNAYMPNTRGHHTNTPDRAGRNPHMDNSVRADAYLDRYEMTGTITRLQEDRHSEEGYYSYPSPVDGYGSHCNSADLSSTSSPEQSISHARHSRTPSSPHGRNLGHRSSHSNSHIPPQNEWSSRSSHAQVQRMGTTPSSGRYLHHGGSNSHASVSLHDPTSPASGSGHHHGSHSHHTGSSTASYASGQSRGSHGHTSNSHSQSLSRTTNTTDAHQTLLTSTYSGSASKTPLRSNVFSNGGSGSSTSDEESGEDLKSPPKNNHAATHASTSHTTQSEEELVPGEINTKHGSINVSPEGHTQGTAGASHRSDHFPSVVSATPEHHSTSNRNRRSS